LNNKKAAASPNTGVAAAPGIFALGEKPAEICSFRSVSPGGKYLAIGMWREVKFLG